MRIVQKNKVWGYLCGGDNDSTRFSEPGVYGHSRIGIREQAPDNGADGFGKMRWNVLANGIMLATTLDGYNSGYQGNYCSGLNWFNDPRYGRIGSDDVNVEGAKYKMRGIRFGKYGEYDASEDEFNKYVFTDDYKDSDWVFTNLKNNYSKTGGFIPSCKSTPNNEMWARNFTSVKIDKNPGVYDVYNSYTSQIIYFMAIGFPVEFWPWFSALPSGNLGNISENPTISFSTEWESGETIPSVTLTVDESKPDTFYDVPANAAHSLKINDSRWNELPLGNHTATLKLSNSEGKGETVAISFRKINKAISLQGNAYEMDHMPASCSIVKAEVLGAGATSSWSVCNNALDPSPAWEEYGGGTHRFGNKEKTAESWAVSWKCTIGGDSATTNSELIKQVGMAVL